jgi:AcrR family transcriptional regulator
MDEVATRAGLSRSTMHFYFASKEDLLAGLLARTHDEIVGPVAILLNAGTAPDRAVRQVLEALLAVGTNTGRRCEPFWKPGWFRPRSAPDGGQQRTKSLMSQRSSSAVREPLGASPRGRLRRTPFPQPSSGWSSTRCTNSSVRVTPAPPKPSCSTHSPYCGGGRWV